MNLLVLDNYDSFTYNLVHYAEELLGRPVTVRRNDAIALDEVAAYDAVLLSPGPGLPSEAGIMPALIQRYATQKPILGICLGHQALGQAFGAQLYNLPKVYHGLATPIYPTEVAGPILSSYGEEIIVGRYHSWVIRQGTLPPEWLVTARDAEGEIMAMRHETLPLFGWQFHPESVLTPDGFALLQNFFRHLQTLAAPAL